MVIDRSVVGFGLSLGSGLGETLRASGLLNFLVISCAMLREVRCYVCTEDVGGCNSLVRASSCSSLASAAWWVELFCRCVSSRVRVRLR
jgi:hypothetical protein